MTSELVFHITRAAAPICLPSPLASGFNPTTFLDHWQTLAGAFLGGLMGVVGALIVAARATRRERRIAASSVLPEVMGLQAANEMIGRAAKVSHLDIRGNYKLTCDMLVKTRPAIRILHSPVITQLYDIDARLYSHLFLCHVTHEHFEPALERYEKERNAANAEPSPKGESALGYTTLLDIRAVEPTQLWNLCVEHAALANYYLDRFIFRPWPVWIFLLRMRFLPNDLDRRSAHLLKEAKLLSKDSTAIT